MTSPIADLITQTSIAMLWEKLGFIEKRNDVAQTIFADRNNRKVTIGSAVVETWYNRDDQLYVTEIVTSDGSYGSSDCTGHKDDAAVAHLWALDRAIKLFVDESKAAAAAR